MVKYQSWWRSPPTARKPSETDAKSCGADAALREMALVDLPSGPVETWSKWLRKGSKVTPSMGIDVLDGSEAPPAPAAPSCRRHTGAPQARLDPPPRTALRRRLVSILHPGRPCAAGSSRSSTRVESGLGVGSCPRLALRAAWSPSSSPSCALRADRAARAAGATPHPSQFCSREPPPPPLACPPRGAPLGLAAPPPPCTLAHASASASADRLSWATSRLQLGANLAADRTGRVFGVVSPVRVPCAVCRATR